MKNKFLIDTSYISSLANENDVNHIKARTIYEKTQEGSIFISTYSVLLELVVMKNANPIPTINLLEKICYKIIEINQNFIKNFLEFSNSNKFNLKAVDSSILFAWHEHGATLLTFDKKLIGFYELSLEKIFRNQFLTPDIF